MTAVAQDGLTGRDRFEKALADERAKFKPGADEWAWALGTVIDNTEDDIVRDLNRSAKAVVHVVTVQHFLSLEGLRDFLGVVLVNIDEFRQLYTKCRPAQKKAGSR